MSPAAHFHHVTDPRDRVPLVQKVAFGLGMATPIAFGNALVQLTNLIFNIGLGVNPIWLGAAQMVPRFWDAISDPLAGYLSDNTRSRWGRRKPYVLVGGLATGICFGAIWHVSPHLSPVGILLFYLATTLLFYTAVTIYTVPLQALGFEMTRDYHERTRLFAYASFIGNVFAILTPWMYWLARREALFANEVSGMKVVGSGVGVLIMGMAVFCGLRCKEQHYEEIQRQPRLKLWSSLKEVMQSRTFLRLLACVFLVTTGYSFVSGFANYIIIYYVFGGARSAASTVMGINGTAWAITALIAVFPMTWWSRHRGKASTVRLAVVLMMAGNLLKIVCYNPAYPLLTLIPTVLISSGMLMLYTMGPAMVADVCNEDELVHGVRREGCFSSMYSWWLKFGGSSALLIAGVLLVATRFNHEIDVQTHYTLFWLRTYEIAIPTLLCAGALVFMFRYPLTEDRAYANKQQLDERRARLAQATEGAP